MDSLTQFTLGSAIGIAVMHRRAPVWKAALIGGLAGTLPDLDAFYDYGNPILDMTLHRSNSHALFWVTLISPLVALIAAKALRDMANFKRWWLAIWLALFTHPLLDWFTVYGTQLLRPFTDFPYAIGSIFIIDPLYTLPLLIGIAVALIRRDETGWRWTMGGLVVSTLYLGWGVAAQHYVRGIAEASLRNDGVQVERLLITPTAFNTVLWTAVAITPQGYLEGFHSLLDADRQMSFRLHPRAEKLYDAMRGNPGTERIAWFSHGFFKMDERSGRIVITDLRMGQAPYYTFNFVVGERKDGAIVPVEPTTFRERHNLADGLRWIWRRMWGERAQLPLL